MKSKKNIQLRVIQIFLVFVCITFFGSCLKDNGPQLTYAGSSPLVSFQYQGVTAEPITSYLVPNPVDTISVEVTFSSSSVLATSTVTATVVALSADSVNAYDTANQTNYVQIPDSTYTIANGGVVTIAPGQQIVQLYIYVKALSLNYNLQNALGLQITSATGAIVATNLNTLIVPLLPKNIEDGQYIVTGSFDDTFDSGFVGTYPNTVDLITNSLNSNYYFDVTLNGPFHQLDAAGVSEYYGGFAPVFTFDETTGAVTSVTNYYSPTDPLNTHDRTAELNPNWTNQYDFATKTLTVSYIMVQAGTPRTYFYETFTYVGPR